VAEEDELRLELGEAPGGAAVLLGVRGQVGLWRMEAGESGQLVDVRKDVAEDQDAVGLAPEGDVACGVAGDVEDLEAGDLVALVEVAVDGVAGADEDLDVEAGNRVVWLALADEVGVLGGVGVALGDPEWDVQGAADLVRGALMVGMGMRERVGGDLVRSELAENLAGAVTGAGVDEDVLDQVGVDRIREEEGVEVPDPVGDLLHARSLSCRAMTDLRGLIRDIPDFPQPGIVFKDATPLFASAPALEQALDELSEHARALRPDVVVAPEARGFILGAAIAARCDAGFIPVRKPGKLPFETASVPYELEYGIDELHMHVDALAPGARVLLHDDLIATGGTIAAIEELVEQAGAEVVGISFLMELEFLEGRSRLRCPEVFSLIRFETV
jgi:adenine phosphoribosyltransferase